MTDLQRLANIAEILGALMLIGGAIFGIMQIREFRAQRRQAVAVELTRSFHNLDLVRAMNLILKLPDGLSAEELRSKGPEYSEPILGRVVSMAGCATRTGEHGQGSTSRLRAIRGLAPFGLIHEILE